MFDKTEMLLYTIYCLEELIKSFSKQIDMR